MKRLILAVCLLGLVRGGFAAPHTFEVSAERDAFLLDGQPFQIRCGELHFARVPRAYWRHRIRMCKAMGLNAVCAYMFWNYHEMQPGRFDFTGEKDVAAFCRIAQEEGMWVVLRPGPYTCAEWEFGGLPWWLLDQGADKVRVRTRDARFLEPAKRYLRRVADELRGLQITHGGPILMVQDENEYGFFGEDDDYIRALYETLRAAGFDVPIFTCNPATQLKKGAIPDVFKVVNFGSNPKNGFAKLREVQPHGPLMCGEYYPAWFDSWGLPHHTKPAQAMIDDIDYMLSVGGSFSLYMAHGGTTFGWWAGMNAPFQPQTSSYDYEAPISEQGRATPKFFALRELMKKYMTDAERAALPEPPAPLPLMAFTSDAEAELVVPADAADDAEHNEAKKPLAMERLGQGYGIAAYYTNVPDRRGGMLKAAHVRDQAAVFGFAPDGTGAFLGFLDRRFPARGVTVPAGLKALGVFVTHMSRYNFGPAMNNAHKGLLPPVTLDGRELEDWWMAAQGPVEKWMPAPPAVRATFALDTPCSFKRFTVSIPPQFSTHSQLSTLHSQLSTLPDTFLLVRGWKKGHVWVNGRPLGRFWGIGPTQTMFVPGCWLKEGANEFVVFDFGGNVPPKGLTFVDTPVLDELHPESDFITAPKRENAPLALPDAPTAKGEFPDRAEAQEVWLRATADGCADCSADFRTVTARQFAFVIDSAWAGGDIASLAEFELLDDKGASVPHAAWTFVHVSSEEAMKEDGTAENAIDGQISNFWHSRWSADRAKGPHALVVDLGAPVTVAGFRYTPRQDNRNGRVKAWRFYLGDRLVK